MTGEMITTISPSTNKPVRNNQSPTDQELAALPSTAQKAFLRFRQTTLAQRQSIVERALQLIQLNQDAFAATITEEMGRPTAYTAKEVTTAILRANYMVRVSNDVLKDTPGDAQSGFQRYIRKMPLGPVLIIFAWNYPWLILVNSLIPALLAGNSVILKPSPQTPSIAGQVKDVFVQAGLDPDVIQYFHCGDFAKVERVIQAPEIKLVCFTGSTTGGLAVQKAAAIRIDCRVGLELGGNDPSYVREDVDMAWAAEEIVDGAVFNSGQSCCAIERVYVHDKIHDEFVAAVQKVLSGYKLGDPTDASTNVGPVISKAAAARIQHHISDALSKGAKDVTPTNASFVSPPPDGNYITPTVLTGCDHSMLVMRDETFGPIIPIQRVRSDGEALELMNESQYGLTATVWTRDVSTGHKLAESIDAGTVFVNRAEYPSPDLAWTGWKDSGKGQTLSIYGFDQFVRLKSYHIKDYPL